MILKASAASLASCRKNSWLRLHAVVGCSTAHACSQLPCTHIAQSCGQGYHVLGVACRLPLRMRPIYHFEGYSKRACSRMSSCVGTCTGGARELSRRCIQAADNYWTTNFYWQKSLVQPTFILGVRTETCRYEAENCNYIYMTYVIVDFHLCSLLPHCPLTHIL